MLAYRLHTCLVHKHPFNLYHRLMELHWCRSWLIESVIRDEYGKPLYRITTDRKPERTTITRFVGGNPRHSAASRVVSDAKSDTDIIRYGLEEVFVAEIVWRRIAQSTFKYHGERIKVKDFIMTAKRGQEKYAFPDSVLCVPGADEVDEGDIHLRYRMARYIHG